MQELASYDIDFYILDKYINSPETEFYKKGNNLYNLNKARKFSNSNDEVFLVEGYMDVIGLTKNKVENWMIYFNDIETA
mgnify:CR=1 FL=1